MTNEQIKKNLIAKLTVEDWHKMTLEEWDKQGRGQLALDFRVAGGGCRSCGAYISNAILKFYSYDVCKVLCYKCQESKKIEDDYPPSEELIYSQKQIKEILQDYQLK